MSGSVDSRRIEDKIRYLCAKMMNSQDAEFEAAAAELQSTVAEHLRRMQNRISLTLLAWPDFPGERRKMYKNE